MLFCLFRGSFGDPHNNSQYYHLEPLSDKNALVSACHFNAVATFNNDIIPRLIRSQQHLIMASTHTILGQTGIVLSLRL